MRLLFRDDERGRCKGHKTLSVDEHAVGTGKNVHKLKFAVLRRLHRVQRCPVPIRQAHRRCAGYGGVRLRPARCLRRWLTPPQRVMAEPNPVDLTWLGVPLGGSGR
jgi:hypothetical protein